MNQAVKKQKYENQGTDKMLEYTISGSYYNSKKEAIDFGPLKGTIPFCEIEVGDMHVRGRYAAKWIKEAVNSNGEKLYPERLEKLRQCFIDDVQETTGTLSFVGKNIKELSNDEIQDLATSKDLREIPLPNGGFSNRDVLIRAYAAYSKKILKKEIKYQEETFNFAKLPPLILTGEGRTETMRTFSNEEILDLEAKQGKPTEYGKRDDPKSRFTIEELKEIADGKNYEYAEDVDFDTLYKALFPST